MKLSKFICASPLLHGRKHPSRSLRAVCLVWKPYELTVWWHLPMSTANKLLIAEPQMKSKHSCNWSGDINDFILGNGIAYLQWAYSFFELFQNDERYQWLRTSPFNAQERNRHVWNFIQLVSCIARLLGIFLNKFVINRFQLLLLALGLFLLPQWWIPVVGECL